MPGGQDPSETRAQESESRGSRLPALRAMSPRRASSGKILSRASERTSSPRAERGPLRCRQPYRRSRTIGACMVEIVYYVATSLDGFIATLDGGIDWLPRLDPEGEDFGYRSFYESVDGLIMGRLTYDKIRRHAAWPYPRKPCWVFTHRPLEAEPPEVISTSLPLIKLLMEMERYKLKRIFLVGGGHLASQFQREGLIAEYNIALVPVLLGTGMPLFAGPGEFERLKLLDTRSFATGEVLMRY